MNRQCQTRSTCPYCGVGCGIVADVENGTLLSITGDALHPANNGKLCVKGSNLANTQNAIASDRSARLSQPQVHGRSSDWPTAIEEIATGFKDTINEFGPDSVAFYLSGQLLTEDYYVANKLMKGFIGSSHVDTNSRLCMSSAVAAQKRAFGEDVVCCDYSDIDKAKLIILVGSNAAWTHPIVYQRIVTAKKNNQCKVIVIDPRRTASCDIADTHLALAPDSDLPLFNGLMSYLAKHEKLDLEFIEQHTNGFEDCLKINDLSLAETAAATNLSIDQLNDLFATFADTEQVLTIYSQGINQSISGTDNANAIINCHLATGKIGKEGCGPFSITGQPNAMGGREVGGLANQLAAHMDFTSSNITKLAEFWQAPRMVQAAGLKAIDLFDAVANGRIKALWIMGSNPAVSLPNSAKVRAALKKCPLLVVSDVVAQTDTTQFADIVLPCTGWGEKDGTVTNSERCISRQRAFLPAFGDAKPDWWAVTQVAHKMGFGEAFNYLHPHDIFVEHAALSGYQNNGERQFDISLLSTLDQTGYENLAPTYWPMEKRVFSDGHFSFADGKACFVASANNAPAVLQTNAVGETSNYPFHLNSGRFRDQWHTMTRTGYDNKLFQHKTSPNISIHPDDAIQLNLSGDDLVRLSSPQGTCMAIVEISTDMKPGEVFMPIHWNQQFAKHSVVSNLFPSKVDPISGQPHSKSVNIKIEKTSIQSWVRYASLRKIEPALEFASFEYWTAHKGKNVWFYEAATDNQTIEKWLSAKTAETRTIEFHDEFIGEQTYYFLCAQHEPKATLTAMASINHLRNLTNSYRSLEAVFDRSDIFCQPQSDWQSLLTGPQSKVDQSPVICSCFEVSEMEIKGEINQGLADLQSLSSALKCGTNCGSCIPELNKLIQQHSAPKWGAYS